MTLGLAVKEWGQHRRALLGVTALIASQVVLLLSFVLTQESPTLLRAATAFAWGGGPILAAFTARRLFVLEHEEGTISLLRALPLPAEQLTGVKFGLALLVNLTFTLGALWIVALLVHRQELIPLAWLLRLSVQVASYVFAWVAICCLMAHLGVYRHALWLLLLLFMLGLDDVVHEPARYLFWTAPLADNLEVTRYAAPWDGIALAVAWGLGATGLMVFLSGHRGGAWVDALYAPMSGRRRAQITAAIFATLLAFEIGADLAKRGTQSAGGLSTEGSVAYAQPDLRALAGRLNGEMQPLSQFLQAELPMVTLAWRHDDRPELALTETLGDQEIIIGLSSAGAQDDLLRHALTDVLGAHTGFLLEANPRTGVWALGFAAYWLDKRGTAKIQAVQRAAAFVARRTPQAPVQDYDDVRASFGRSGAEALGWLAWRRVAKAGAEPTEALARALFGTPRHRASVGLLAAAAIDPIEVLTGEGLSPRSLDRGTQEGLRSLAQHQPALPSIAPPSFWAESQGLGGLRWSLPDGLDPQRVTLWWATVEPLSQLPIPQARIYEVPVLTSWGRAALAADPRDRVITQWSVDGINQGWTELHRR